MICYDLRFPELLRYPARSGAAIAFYVAQWPSARLNHWQVLLKARAIENNMYVIGCNGCGYDGKRNMPDIPWLLILMAKSFKNYLPPKKNLQLL